MAVSNYTTDTCKYFNWNLAKEVYLVYYDAVESLWIDNGDAYVKYNGMSVGVRVNSINVEESESLDERYAFTHQVTFSVSGYANKSLFQGNYYIILRNEEGTYWIVNPFFPCKVSYTFEYSNSINQTTFTANTVSNLPILRLLNFDGEINYECNNYSLGGVKHLLLNERQYSRAGETTIEYTNDGFKVIKPQKNTTVFQESFDGMNYSQTLSFSIPFAAYKSSWHYNLLEFTNNKYAAVIVTNDDDWILAGFDFGLQPSFEIQAFDAKSDPSNITITLRNVGNYGHTIRFIENGLQVPLTETDFVFTSKYDGYECVDEGTAKYLLQEEVDALGTPTGNYKALSGYSSQFPQLNIVGTFTDVATFNTSKCNSFGCKVETNMPDTLTFRNANEDVVYNFKSNVAWTIASSSQYITVSPSAGTANTLYQVHFTNTYDVQPNVVLRATLSATTCGDNVQTYNVIVSKGSECFTSGLEYNISANGQTLKIPFNCCLSSWSTSASAIHSFQYLTQRYLSFYVDENRSGTARTMTVNVTFCDGYSGSISVVQGASYERWVTEGQQCNNGEKCDFQRKYSGTTSTEINTPTDVTRLTNCTPSNDCKPQSTRWAVSDDTTCYDNILYKVEIEQISFNSGQTWVATGKKRLGDAITSSTACQDEETYSQWIDVEGEYLCDGTSKYKKSRKWISADNVTWFATDVYMLGDLIEENSSDCGYETPYQYWRFEYWSVTDGYICDDGNKYEKLQRWVSSNGASYQPIDVFKKGDLIDSNSVDCGFYPAYYDYAYSKYQDDDDYTCDGVHKYHYLRKYFSNDNVNWIASDIYKTGDLIQNNSVDCGYVPTPLYVDWREVSGEYLCNAGNKYKKLQQYVSENGSTYYPMDVYKMGSLIQSDSTDCGAITPVMWEYQWVLTDETQCGYELTSPFTFTFLGGATAITSSLTYTQTSVTAYVVSENDGEYVSYQATNVPEWINNVEINADTVTVEFGSNPTTADRTAQITLVQSISNESIYINIVQAAYAYDDYTFTWDSSTAKTINVGSATSGNSYQVISLSGSTLLGYGWQSKPDWVNYIECGTRFLTIGWEENTTGDDRSGTVVLFQYDSYKTITLTINQGG